MSVMCIEKCKNIYDRPYGYFVDKFNLLKTFFRKYFTKKYDHPSFLIFVSILTKIHKFTNYMEKNIFLKLEFKSFFSTKKY